METSNDAVKSQLGSEDLQGMYAAYKKQKEVKKRLSKEEKLAKFFFPRRDKEIFRALPPTNRDSSIPQIKRYFEEGYFHEIKTGKKYRKISCPAHNDPKIQALDKETQKPAVDQNGSPVMISVSCPLCKKVKTMLATQDRSILTKTKGKKKEELERILTTEELRIFQKNKDIYTEASKIEAKKFYMLRGIDRGAEKDGVKFWRFKQSYKNQGTYDKLMAITEDYYAQSGDFTDINKGTDFSIIVIDAQIPGKTYTYRDISAIIPRGPSKLNNDPIVEKQWLEDKTGWREVYKPLTAPKIDANKFLELAAEDLRDMTTGKIIGTNAPYYDDTDATNKRWIIPNHPDLEAETNRRDENLDADDDDYVDEESNLGVAATTVVTNNNTPQKDITTISDNDVKTFNHGSVNLGNTQVKQEVYDDLPF